MSKIIVYTVNENYVITGMAFADVPAGGSTTWGVITGTLSSQTDLQSALNAKAASLGTDDNYVTDAEKTNLHAPGSDNQDLSGYSLNTHAHAGVYEPANANIQSHVISAHAPSNAQKNSDITQGEIEAKLVGVITSHSHSGGAASWGGITGTLSSQTDLQTALNGKQASGSYEPANSNIQGHVVSAHAPANAQANADITKAEIEAKLTGVIVSHSHSGGGGDPWTYIKLASDFTTTSATAVDVTGLFFTPAANLDYEFEAVLRTRTATATVGPRPGLAWATGLTDGAAQIKQPSSATAELTTNGNISAAMLCAVGGVPTTTGSWQATIRGSAKAGTTPSGTIKVQLASETAGTVVTIKAGSFLKYRSY
ncbi:MAG: hypothetical protein WAW75_03150 [Gallionella sp.]